MKTKITILLISLFVLAFSAQALAEDRPVAYIIGAETQTTDVTEPVYAETILVQLSADLVDPTLSWIPAEWDLILGDFKILDGITLVPVTAAEVAVNGNNYISLSFDYTTYQFDPDENDLKLHYLNYSGIPITTEWRDLQNTSTAINIDDGIAPILYNYKITSNNANEFLGEAGDVVTFEFEADEALALIPVAPQVTFTVPEMKYSETVDATTTDPNQKIWTAAFTIPSPGANLNGKVTVSASFWDVHANLGGLAATDTGTDGSFVTVKNYDPTYTYVGAGFNATTVPDPVSGDIDDQIYLWNVFNTVQEAIDAVASGGSVNVTTGAYNEDLTIATTLELLPYEAPPRKAYDIVTLKGVATVAAALWPLAAPNIDIQATGVSIHNFKIEAPDYVVGFYSSGIVVGATNATIYNNDFFANIVSSTDDISQSIQTYNGVDVSGLDIYTNTFTHKAGKWTIDWGYEAIYINPGGTGLVNIEDNTIGGKLFRGITAQRSNCNIEANNISTDLNPVSDDWVTAGAWVGIWAYDDISDVVITGNTVQGNVGGAGFNRGIRLGHTGGSTFTNLSVTSNEIYYNKKGIYSQSATGITITGNAIENNTAYGIFCDTGTLDAEHNWWGSANGPTHVNNTYNVALGQGDVSSDHVDYVPWYDTDMTHNSFAPIEKDDGLKAITYFSSFQTAIDAAAPGDEISATTGFFDEQFTVDVQNLTIQSMSGETATIQPTAAPVPAFYDVQVFASYTTLQDLVFDFGDRESVFTGIVVGEFGEPLCPATVSNVTISYNDFYSDGVAIQTGYTIDINDLLIDFNFFYLDSNAGTVDGAGGIYVSPFPDPPGKDGITISNNWFEGYVDYGVAIDASNVTVTDNYIFGAGSTVRRAFIRYIDWYGNDNDNVVITYNEMADISRGIWVQSFHDPIGSLSGTIQYNYFTDCNEGILLATGLTTSLEITENDFVTTVVKGINTAVNNTTTVLADCENNWWNSVNGPTHAGNTFNVTAQGENVTDYVDYVPWLDDEFDVGIPFAPVELWETSFKFDKNKLREENLSFKDVIKNGFKQFSSIQTAIDAYDDVLYDWAGIGCYAGTFTEDFVADKDDIWFEGEYTKQLVTLLGDQEVTGNYVWFDEFEFDPQAGVALLLNSSAATIDGTWIYDCTFTIDESGDVGIYVGGSASPNAVTYTWIENNVFNGPTDMNSNPFKVGGWFGTNIGCEIDGLYFDDNEVNYGSIPINLVDENVTDIYIGYNDFLNTDGAIYFWNNSGTPPAGELSYFDFSNNYVPSSNSYGIAIGGPPLGDPIFVDDNFGDGIEIYYNAFEMSGVAHGYYGAVYMADQYTGLLDASNNWWGDANGPENDNNTYTPPAPLKGRATVSDRVEFAPWYNDGTNTAPGRGWMPLSPSVDYLFAPVINVTQTTYHSSIQRAVDGATTSDSISCLAGTFDECVTIDKNIKLAGDSSAKGTTYLAPSFAHVDAATVKNVTDAPVLNADFQSVLLVDYTGTALTTIKDFVIDGSAFNTGDPASGGYFAGILFDETAGTVTNISFDYIYTLTDNKGVGVVVNDNSGTDKTTEVEDCDFNACPTGALWLVHPNAMGNIHDNTLDGSRNTIMFLSSSSTTASIVDNNTLTNCTRAVLAYPFNADVKIDITDNTFDFSGTALATSVDAIIGNSSDVVFSFDLNIDNNDFIGNYPPGSKPAANDSKPINFNQNCTGTTITNNTFDNFYRGIFLNSNPPNSVVTNLAITNNVFTDIALNVISIEAGMVGVNTMAINYNSFDTNSAYAIWSVHADAVDATKNWYGDATGPDDDGDVNPHTTPLGAKVSEHVTFIPWYATSTVTPTTEYVRTHELVPKTPVGNLAYSDIIQACIDAAAGVYFYVEVSDKGAKISVPYTENLSVDHQAYIYKQEPDKASPPVTIIGTHVITGDNVTFYGFTLTPGALVSGTVITINSASQVISNTTIDDCQFDIQTSPSIGVYVGGGTPTNAVINTYILYCTFNGPADMISNPFKVGGSFGSPVGCEIIGLYFEDNYVNHGSIPINLVDKDILGLELTYNDFTNTDGVIYFWAEDAIKSPTGEISFFYFGNNYVGSTNTYGVGFDVNGNFTSANYGSSNDIYENYFDLSIPGAYGFDAVSILTPTADLAGYVLDATDNWWGSEDGPSHSSNTFNVPTQGVAVSDNVDFVRWYDSGAGYADPGWIPTGSLFAPVRTEVKGSPYFSSIQAAIDDASSGFCIICYAAPTSGTGTFYEDFSVPASKANLVIRPFNIFKAYDDVTIKGQATVEASLWPLAGPNIEILGSGTSLHHFTIEAPNYVEGYYSSGIVVGATNVEINYNTFINNTVATANDISQSIQTYLGVDCSTLNIVENTFTDNLPKTSYWGYEGIYINPGCGSSYIYDNDFLGMCLRAITIENASPSFISANWIETSMAPVPDSWATPGAYQGINLQGDLTDIIVEGNYIAGINPACGFAQGIRLGSDGDTFIFVDLTYNTLYFNSYGVLCKSATGVAFNHNNLGNNAFGVQNDDITVKTVLNATHNYWGAADGPSFTFDYGMGSGSGDLVSEYVDFYPWYVDAPQTTLYDLIMAQFLLAINPASPFVDNYFDLRVCAADAAGIRDFSYDMLADFSSSHVALSVPEEQLLVDGFKEITGACISSLPFEASDHLDLYAWEYMTNPPDYLSEITDIVIQELNNPAAPTGVVFTDLPNDNGGWILVDYTLSIDDPFYTTVKDTAYGVSYYVVEIDTIAASGQPDYHFLATIACYDNGSGTNDYTALLPAPASDTKYNFRMASVYNPTKLGGFDENHISYTEIVTKDAGAQSTWQYGSAAPMDNLPAYANMKVFFEGPYQAGGTMIDGLTLPTVSPYDLVDIGTLPTVASRTLIDWIYVELRNTATGATVKEANAFVLDNSMIVDTEGNYSLPFYYTTDVEYYIVIHHRNHLDIMSAATHTFGDFASQATTIDLTTVGTAYLNGFKEVDTGVYAMYDGDANGSELVNVNDAYDLIDHFGMAGYLGSDLNLSGYVNVNDAYELIDNFGVGSSVPGNTLKGGLNDWQNIDFNVPITTGTKVLECTLEIKGVQVVAGVSYSFDVYITRNTSNWSALGHLTFLTETYYSELAFNYNGSALNNPVVSNLSPVATGTNVSTPSSGVLAIEVLDGGINVPVSETKLLTVTFDITDPAATSQLSWRTGDTSIINELSNNYNTAAGTLSLLGSDDSTLPVELSSFDALYCAIDENIELRWDTATENDVNGFNIYRSEFKDLTRAGRHINYSLISAAGTTTEPQSYIYSDVVGDVYVTHYYWLEVVDFGGTSSFHGPIAYTPGDIDGDSTPDLIVSTQLLGNFPNPAINSTQIRYQIKGTVIDQNATISVYNVRGEFVKTVEGRNGVATLDTSALGQGIYFYRLQTEDYSDIKKLIVVK